jgi:small subunit ribosomal protein S6
MRRYETIVIVDADVSENDRVSLLNRIQEIIPQQEGVLIKEDLWGVKKLAYEIKKKPRGYYARYDYCGKGPLVDELERFFRIDDRVLKYLTVLLDPDADVEKIQAELAATETDSSDAEVTTDQAQPAAEEASPADQESPPATEATESATETSIKE